MMDIEHRSKRSRIHGALALLSRTRQLWRLNFSVPTRVAGTPFKVPIVFGEGRQVLAQLEPWLLETLARVFSLRTGAFLDVGVNLGQTLLKAKALDRERPYYGFEPNPRCCHYVEQLVRANGLPQCWLIPAGLSETAGVVTLKWTRNADVDSCASIVPGFFPDESAFDSRYVSVVNGDAAVREIGIGDVAAIKVDVEGAELDVLRGLTRTLERARPYVVCEILPVADQAAEWGRQRTARQQELCALLATLGYDLFRVHVDATVQLIERIEPHPDLSLSNYVAAPREQRAAFLTRFPERQPTAA